MSPVEAASLPCVARTKGERLDPQQIASWLRPIWQKHAKTIESPVKGPVRCLQKVEKLLLDTETLQREQLPQVKLLDLGWRQRFLSTLLWLRLGRSFMIRH